MKVRDWEEYQSCLLWMEHPPALPGHHCKKPKIIITELFFILMLLLLTLVGEENVNGNPSVVEYQRSCLHRLALPNTNLNAILILQLRMRK